MPLLLRWDCGKISLTVQEVRLAKFSLFLTETVHSLGIFSKSLNESCESKVACFLTPCIRNIFETI